MYVSGIICFWKWGKSYFTLGRFAITYGASRLREEHPCLIGWFTWVSERCSRSDFCPRLKIVRFGHVCNVCTKTLCFVPSRKVRSESKTTYVSHNRQCPAKSPHFPWERMHMKIWPADILHRNCHVTIRDLLADSLSQRMSRAVSSENLTLAITVLPLKSCVHWKLWGRYNLFTMKYISC